MIEYATVDDHVPGDFHRNSQGKPLVAPPGGGRKRVYNRPSDWPFDDYSGIDPIYANRGTWVHTLTEMLDTTNARHSSDASAGFRDEGIALGISIDLQVEIGNKWRAFRKAHGLVARHVEVKVVNDTHMVAGTVDRVDEATAPIVTPFGTVNPGDLVVCDIKTGSKVVKASYAAQLPMYVDGVPYDVDTDTRGEW
jgi:hypothetical protein